MDTDHILHPLLSFRSDSSAVCDRPFVLSVLLLRFKQEKAAGCSVAAAAGVLLQRAPTTGLQFPILVSQE